MMTQVLFSTTTSNYAKILKVGSELSNRARADPGF